MHNELNVRMFPYKFAENFSKNDMILMSSFGDAFKEFIIKKKRYKDEYIDFSFTADEKGFEKILAYLVSLEGKIGASLYFQTEYDKEDFNNASAYMLYFSDEYSGYSDDDDPYYPRGVLCEECGMYTFYREKVYAKPSKGILKKFNGRTTGVTSKNFTNISILSEDMYEYLLSEGIDESCFRDVYAKNGDKWAKCLDNSKNMLRSGDVECSLYECEYTCKKCGSGHFILKEPDNSKNNWGNLRKVEFMLAYGRYPLTEKWEIKQEALNRLEYVNLTIDVFESYSRPIINRELFELIIAKEPNIIKRSVPIFLKTE